MSPQFYFWYSVQFSTSLPKEESHTAKHCLAPGSYSTIVPPPLYPQKERSLSLEEPNPTTRNSSSPHWGQWLGPATHPLGQNCADILSTQLRWRSHPRAWQEMLLLWKVVWNPQSTWVKGNRLNGYMQSTRKKLWTIQYYWLSGIYLLGINYAQVNFLETQQIEMIP